MQNPMNGTFIQSHQSLNQNSITNKLCKFFKNLLELEKDQGRYDESVAIIQRYINKEISIDELGTQLKGNASRAQLPESLMSSLKSNIDDLRREMYFGRVKIDRINPPPESVINQSSSLSNNNTIIPNNLVSAVNARLSASQLLAQRPTTMVRQTAPLPQPSSQIIRHSTPQSSNVVQTRPVGNATASQVTNIRASTPTIQNVSTVVNNNNIRTVSIPTSALINVKPVKSEEPKLSANEPQKAADCKTNTTSLPNTILNHANYRTKINDLLKLDHVNISEEAVTYISDAIERFSTSLLEQAAAFACHRQEVFTGDPMYKKIDDVRSQLKYLQDYDDYQRASEEERQKAELFKAAKSRSKIDNQEQQKLKETVRKIQEHDKNCDEYSRANMTALKAIGSKRKMFDAEEAVGTGLMGAKGSRSFIGRGGGVVTTESSVNVGGPGYQMYRGPGLVGNKQPRSVTITRQRNKRIILKDFHLVLDQDAKLRRFKTYKKIFMFGRY